MTILVKILYTEGCGNFLPTVELIKNIANEMDCFIDLETVKIESMDQAEDLKFLGSPTIQINGLDIDPSARDAHTFGFM